MYYKDNGKSNKCSSFGDGYTFCYYEFSKVQQWLEVGQKLQRIYNLHRELAVLIQELETEHGPIKQEKYDKVTGFTTGTAKPIKHLIDTDRIKYLSRLIEEAFLKDLDLITRVCHEARKFRPYKNLLENIKMYGESSKLNRKVIEEQFEYIGISSLSRNFLDFWDELRKYLDDKTNEIIIPETSIENREFFNYFLQARENYCEGNKEIALAIIRKALEDILTRFWVLHFDNLSDMDFNQKPDLDNLPGYLKSKGILEEQEFREAQPFIKYGNAGIHIKGEIPIERLELNAKQMINNAINFINNLCDKYKRLMIKKNYCYMIFTKTGYSIGIGNFQEYLMKQTSDEIIEKDDVEEYHE